MKIYHDGPGMAMFLGSLRQVLVEQHTIQNQRGRTAVSYMAINASSAYLLLDPISAIHDSTTLDEVLLW